MPNEDRGTACEAGQTLLASRKSVNRLRGKQVQGRSPCSIAARFCGAYCWRSPITAVPVAASAQQSIKLTIIDGYPPKALWVKVLIDYFIPEVNSG